MKNILSYRAYPVLGRLALAVMFFVASSGFTMVLHSCLMDDAVCCSMASSAGSPDRHADGATVSKVASSCCESTVVGGLNRTVATLEQSSPAAAKAAFTAPAIVGPDASGGDGVFFMHALHARPPDSPPNGLYLSNASLLI